MFAISVALLKISNTLSQAPQLVDKRQRRSFPIPSPAHIHYNLFMALPKHLLWLFVLSALFIAGCNNGVDAPVLTIAPTASVNQPADDSSGNFPPTTTPVIPATPLPVEGSQDLEAIDAVLQEIDSDLCREAHEARAEIAELLAEGQDVADLETAIIELINELDNCSLEMTPGP